MKQQEEYLTWVKQEWRSARQEISRQTVFRIYKVNNSIQLFIIELYFKIVHSVA